MEEDQRAVVGGRLAGALGGAVLVAVYVALAFAGRELGQFGALSVWYPPAGVAFAAGALYGWRTLPFLALGELAGGILVFHVDTEFSSVQMLVNAVGYAGVYVAAAHLVDLIGPDRRDRVGLLNRLPLLFVGVAAAAPVAAAFGVAMQRWAGLTVDQPYLAATGIWWLGDALGVASVGSVLLVIGLTIRSRRGRPHVPVGLRRDPPVTAVTLLSSPALVAAAVYEARPQGIGFIAVAFVPLALVALRYGGAGAAIANVAVAPVVTAVANRHVGSDLIDRTDLQLLLLSAIVASLVVGSVVDERARTSRHDAELRDTVEGMADLVVVVGRDGQVRHLNPAARRLLGLRPDEPIGRLFEEDMAVDDAERALITEARRTATGRGGWEGEVRLRGADGRVLVGSKRVLTHRDERNEVVRWTTLVRDVTEQRKLEHELARVAVEDSLTGIANREYVLDRLRSHLGSVAGGRAPGVILLVKLDRIGMLMGGLGIELADEMLRQVAARLVSTAGQRCCVGRLEGVTFGILPDDPMGDDEALALAEAVVEAIGVPLHLGDRVVPVTCSVGVATIDGTTPLAEVVRAADVAAQRAQEEGGGRAVRHDTAMTEGARDRLVLEAALGTAVRERSWTLSYQPIGRFDDGDVVAVEALLRFPADLPTYPLVVLAESNGLIVPLGEAVLERAARTAAAWDDAGGRLDVHVNVSGRQLVHPGFVDSVGAVLASTGLEPGRLTLELTETALVDDLDVARRVLDALVRLGVNLALDDFGTGQSSLRVLANLPFHAVKLDQFLTRDVETSHRARALVRATVDFARALDVAVVAEGVESEAQRDVLAELGCDLLQGHLLSAAMPPGDVPGFAAGGGRRGVQPAAGT